jgi:ribonuclease E
MTKRMLIDATHAEETRVVVLDGNRLEDFDVETSTKRQLKGNIYLAKVVRVEPSLQAAFVEYGGNRHGFLAFGEIHPDYYQIPVADRQRLIEQEAEEARREEEEEDRAAEAAASEALAEAEPSEGEQDAAAGGDGAPAEGPEVADGPEAGMTASDAVALAIPAATLQSDVEPGREAVPIEPVTQTINAAIEVPEAEGPTEAEGFVAAEGPAQPEVFVEAEDPAEAEAFVEREGLAEAEGSVEGEGSAEAAVEADDETAIAAEPIPEPLPPETVGGEGDGTEETRERRFPPRFLRNYKIQEVIKRRQILLVQVVKEERGTKGAALTTYLSLAGRFCVLMPNSPRGGGISRKITSATDRRRLKDIMAELEIPKGMGLIVRTAGANRPKPEIRRDCEYLLRLWDDIREHTLRSVAPALIYEEASLIKRAIRDVYSRDIDEIQVDGESGWRAAHEFMRMLMPTHAKKVQLWKNGGLPLFTKYQVEAQLDAMLLPIVQLRSGGYLVINQAEALVAIDVNSGRSTRERGIEETALRTNLEAADEVARQLRLRDLAGLIVIDFIDMETRKHNAMVEKRLKEALKTDRARIQVGHISHFGLMEMSRQRLRPSLTETSFISCPHCGGTGHVRSTENAAIHVLRGIEEEGARRRAAEIVVYAAPEVALYILNHKRARLADIELRFGMSVFCLGEDAQMASQFRIERLRAQAVTEAPAAAITQAVALPPAEIEVEEEVPGGEDEDEEAEADLAHAETDGGETPEEAERRRRRRRRRRRSTRREEGVPARVADDAPGADETLPSEMHIEGVPEHAETADEEHRVRRRGRRGGRRRRQEGNGEMPAHAEPGADQPDLPPVYSGPTPANPFGGQTFDIFDVLEREEETAPTVLPALIEPVAEPSAAIIVDEPASGPSIDEPVPAAVAEEEPSVADVVEPEPVAIADEPTSAASEAPASAPELAPEDQPGPVITARDVASEPAITPFIIGSDQDVTVEKKRGWWRR